MKKTFVITTLIAIIILISGYIASSTYAIIDNLTKNDNKAILNYDAIDNQIIYNYLTQKLSLTDEEAKIVINSINLNNILKDMLNNNYNNEELSQVLTDNIDNNQTIDNELKEKLKSGINKNYREIDNYVYKFIQKEKKN